MRCSTLIHGANKTNAKYIMNVSDVRTHGPRELDEFEVRNGSDVLQKFEKFEDARINREDRVAPINANINSKRSELSTLGAALESIPDVPGNETARSAKIASIMVKSSEIQVEEEKKIKLHVAAKPITKTVSKTGIICRKPECQDPTDTIIWG